MGTKEDSIPFLMLPLRVETRFMEVFQDESESSVNFSNALFEIVKLQDNFRVSTVRITFSNLNSLITEINNGITALGSTHLKNLGDITSQQRSWLRDELLELGEMGNNFYEKLEGQRFNQDQKVFIKKARNAFQSAVKKLLLEISKVKIKPKQTFKEASELIAEMLKLESRARTLLSEDLPNTKIGKKDKLVAFVKSAAFAFANFYKRDLEYYNTVVDIEKTQLERIKELHTSIKETIKKVPAKLEEVHTDAGWKKFVEEYKKNTIDTLKEHFTYFEEQVLGKFEQLEKLKIIPSSKLFYDSLKALKSLRDFNKSNIKDFDEARTKKAKILSRLKKAAIKGQQVIQANDKEAGQLENLWIEINSEVKTFTRLLPAVTTSNRSQKFSLESGLKTIGTIASSKVTALSNISKGLNKPLSAKTVATSNTIFSNTVSRIDNVEKNLKKLSTATGRVSSKQRDQLLKDVEKVFSTLKNANEDNLVLDQKRKKELEKKSKAMARMLKKVKELDTGDETINVEAMGVDLQNVLDKGTIAAAPGVDNFDSKFEDIPVVVPNKKLVNQLWVRIYPDDIAIQTHEEPLTLQEVASGKDYWKEFWIASGDKDMELGAWRAFCELYGSERAAYIAGILDPHKVNAENSNKFEEKPDIKISEALDLLKTVFFELHLIKESDAPNVIISKTEGNTVVTKLNAVHSALQDEGTVHVYSYNKLVNELRKIQSRFTIVVQAIQETNSVALQNVFGPMFEVFTPIQEQVAGFTVLESADFFRKTEINYIYPDVATKVEGWTIAPHSRVMPDRFVVLTKVGNTFRHITVGNRLVGERLQVGLDPEKFDLDNVYRYTNKGDLEVDHDIKWLTDYKTAEAIGMAVTVPLDLEDMKRGFDQVIVLGINKENSEQSQKLLEDLLENHHFTPGGMELLSLGTPTNNTEDSKAGFSTENVDFEERYEVEMGKNRFRESVPSTDLESDGKLLSEALGIPYSIFQHIKGAEKEEMSMPRLFNRALFPATMGYYMHEMMDKIFLEDDVERTGNFFADYVSGRGKLPSLRIDAQPYGIMPTTAFSRFEHHLNSPFHTMLVNILKIMNEEWGVMRKSYVPHAYNVGADSQAHFMEMLGLQPASVEHYIRYGANTFMTYSAQSFPEHIICDPSALAKRFGHLFSLEIPAGTSPAKIKDELLRLRTLKFSKSKIYSATFFEEHSVFTGTRIQEDELSFKTPLEAGGSTNYINWLLDKSLFQILAENDPQQFPAKTMLFVLLRQSLLWSYDRAALDILRKEEFISVFDQFRIGGTGYFDVPFAHTGNPDLDAYATKWSFLFRSLNRLDGGTEHRNGLGFKHEKSKALYDHIVKGSSTANNEDWTMAKYLDPIDKTLFNSFTNHGFHNSSLAPVNLIRNAMKTIAKWPSAALDQLLAEHLDLCSYRLDGWLLGLANERLDQQRRANRDGIYLASWGYLEDLRPGGARVAVSPELVPESLKDSTDSIYTDEDNKGHIHMPSINHAITAAILRAGYTANSGAVEDVENQMAVNLSSARVRKALQLIEGVKNGQEIAAILGYQLERGLHERYQDAEMDKFIYPLRKKFPLRPDINVVANDDNYNPHVVHGNDLLDLIDDHLESLTFPKNLSLFEVLFDGGNMNTTRCPKVLKDIILDNGGGKPEWKILLQEIDRMADSFDALGDLAISESVYQIAQGNHVRAGAVLEALSQGKNIPDPQISTIPRTGTVVDQRVVLCLETIASSKISTNGGLSASTVNTNRNNAKPAGWLSKLTPRALAEPSLNKFLGEQLGPAGNIRCLVNFERGNTSETLVVTVEELGLQPMDFLALLGTGKEGTDDLNKRIAFLVRAKANPKLAVGIPLKILTKERSLNWNEQVRTFYEIMPLVKQLQKMLVNVRAVNADDLRLPPQEAEERIIVRHQDVAEFKLRTDDAEGEFLALIQNINDFFAGVNLEELDTASFSQIQIGQMRQLLFTASDFGLPVSIPDAVIEFTNEVGRDLARQLIIVHGAMVKKINTIIKLRSKFEAETNQDRKCNHLVEVMHQIFDRSFIVIPHFTLQNKLEIQKILMMSTADGLLRNDPFAMDDWLHSIGRVREKMYALEMAEMLNSVFDREFPQATPVQFPYRAATDSTPADYWLGAPYPDTYMPDGDKLSLVLFGSDKLMDGTTPKSAMIIDEWMEIIPHKEETTALTFNYDQPDAAPPQSLLLAVTPKVKGKWDWDDLVYTILDTMELAKNRAVEPDHIEKSLFARVLPAISSEIFPPNLTEEQHGMLPKTQVGLDFLAINEETP